MGKKLIKKIKKHRVLNGLKKAVSEVNSMMAGKKKMKTIDELIREL